MSIAYKLQDDLQNVRILLRLIHDVHGGIDEV